jgi:hypothetical protein
VEDDHFLHRDPDATEQQKYSSPHSRRCHEADLNFSIFTAILFGENPAISGAGHMDESMQWERIGSL